MESLTTNELIDNKPTSSKSYNDIGQSQIDQDAQMAAKLAQEEAQRDRDCASDAALALILQKQFDLDYDTQLKRQEDRLNGHSKVGVSLDKYKRTPRSQSSHQIAGHQLADNEGLFYDSDGQDLEINIDSELAAWDVFEQSELKQRSRMMGRAGFVVGEDGSVITKHDIPTTSRKNMCRLMELKTDIQTGDGGKTKDDFKLNNYVYNQLKVHSKKSSRRASQRMFLKRERENAAILEDIQSVKMSDATRAIMDGLLVAYKIEKLNGVIGHGKESTVLHATGRDHEDNPGVELAIKIFKSDNTMAFKTRDTYNKSKCPSYKFDKPKSKNDSLNKWAERGFKTLKLLRRADINCPDAISLKKHVLVMTFLGTDASPAPQLKEAKLDERQLRESYEQIVDIMERMYQKCELIHGDLSEYNLLWHNEQVYVIDVSQSMFASHPNANSFLFRDCKNIVDFYQKSGLDEVMDAKSLFKRISGKDLSEKEVELWSKIEDFPCNEKLMQKDENSDRNYQKSDSFEHMLQSVASNKKPATAPALD